MFAIGWAWDLIFNLAKSRLGQLAIAFAIAWFWAGWRTDAAWQARVAAEKAEIERQYQAELARQAVASAQIAQDAARRVEEEKALNLDLQKEIERYANEEKKIPSMAHCTVDDDFVDVVRKLSPPVRAAKPSGAAGKLRKAR